MRNPNLKKVVIKSTIKNNIINVERFRFKVFGFRPRIEGQTSFNGELNLKMRLGLPPLGIIGIPIRVTGTQDEPVVCASANKPKLSKKPNTPTIRKNDFLLFLPRKKQNKAGFHTFYAANQLLTLAASRLGTNLKYPVVMENRISQLETAVYAMQSDIKELKGDIKELKEIVVSGFKMVASHFEEVDRRCAVYDRNFEEIGQISTRLKLP